MQDLYELDAEMKRKLKGTAFYELGKVRPHVAMFVYELSNEDEPDQQVVCDVAHAIYRRIRNTRDFTGSDEMKREINDLCEGMYDICTAIFNREPTADTIKSLMVANRIAADIMTRYDAR